MFRGMYSLSRSLVPPRCSGVQSDPSASVDQSIMPLAWILIHPSRTSHHSPSRLSEAHSPFPVHLPLNSRQLSLKSKSPSGLFRRLTTKLKPPSVYPRSANSLIASPPNSPTQSSTRRSAVPVASTDAAAIQRRRAALQQCGLVPLQRKDLSRLEEELDQRFSHLVVLPQDQPEQGELTTAEKIRREWQTKNEAHPEKQGGDLDPKVPSDSTSDCLHSELLGKSDLTGNAEEEKTPELIIPPSPRSSPSAADPASTPGTCLSPDIPEGGVTEPENEKVRHLVLFQSLRPLDW